MNDLPLDGNVIDLNYAGTKITHRITTEDVAGFVAERLAPYGSRVEFEKQLKDALTLTDIAFDLRGRFGFAQLFGSLTGFKTYLLNKMKGQ